MGKTAKGAVWLDENKTTPYEFYQYWRNIADDDVEKCMKLLTFLPLEQIEELCAHKDERINKAKEVLAFELTKEVHGEEKAKVAESQAKAAFGGGDAELLTKEVEGAQTVVDAMVLAGIAKSKGEARRLIEQGGVSVDETKVTDPNMAIPSNEFVLHKGKKVHVKIIVK
jgi:tyrosyl-tRNA synthetase